MTVTRTISRSGIYVVEVITGPGTLAWQRPYGVSKADILVVAGGGGGGGHGSSGNGGGGGAGGGVIYQRINVPSSVTITVGDRGAASSGGLGGNGGNSSFGSTIVATGGGGGGSNTAGACSGANGGSGGGAGCKGEQYAGGNGTSGQGYAGGKNYIATPYPSGGGGGAGGIGDDGTSGGSGNGGIGFLSSITGAPHYYGSGGGGGTFTGVKYGAGGNESGGNGATSGAGSNGLDAFGGGGGGGNSGYGGTGGYGCVIIRYLDPVIAHYRLWTPSIFDAGAAGTDYVFDPVNVDHGLVAGAGAQDVEEGAVNVNAGITPNGGAQDVECGAENKFHAIYPTASWAQIIDPVVDSGYLIGVTVSQSMDDAMAEAVFEYDGNEIGNYFSGDYMTKIHVNIPDHLGVSNCVFVGIIPSSKAVYDVAKDKMTMRAVDYGLFLTKQTMEIKDLSLLPPDDQTSEGANVAKVLDYKNRLKIFQLGMNITGNISGATGTIMEIVSGDTYQRMTLYPATGKFVDSEYLRVGGVDYAQADGRSVDIPYTPYYQTTSPEDWVRSILGGDNWMRVTGIEPCYLEDSSGYWDTPACPAVPFMFGSLEKKRDALKRLAAYMSYLWHVKPRNLGSGNYVQSGYFIMQTSIDTLLGLPAAATITGPDNFAGQITLDQDGEMQVDVVKVRCQDLQGNWLEAIRSNSYYDAGEGPYREFRDEPKDICAQSDLDAYAIDMYNLYSARTCSWSGTLLERSDLQIYQLINISGMGIEVPDGIYRIIKISHEFGCAKNLTHITFMISSSFSTLLKYGMTYKDSISKVQQIVEGIENRKPQVELATVTATNGWTITYTTEAGNKGMGRDSTSTPAVAGSIPVGAKIQIQTIRGGVVCLPIVAASGSSTDLLVVDVPTGVAASVDPADANYWFLTWTPGTNNQTVSTNYQTTGYPSAPGVVLPYGNPASCHTAKYSISTRRVRIRFSGPLTTYYVKLWGEKNGVYSATGATTTITSGAGVTVGDEEPEPIVGVIDQMLSGETLAKSEYGHPNVVVYDALLPYSWNGTDNFYVGGPVSNTSVGEMSPTLVPPYTNGWPLVQVAPRYLFVDNALKIEANGKSIQIGAGGWAGWAAPVLINSILVVGANHVKISIVDDGGYRGVSELWLRTYYL